MIDHWALTTGMRDLPLAKSVVVVTGFCFSNTVNILSSSKKLKTNKPKSHTNDDPGYNKFRWRLNETL